MAIVEPIPSDVSGRRRLRLRNPATLEPVGEIEVQTAAEVGAAVERARKAQPEWAALKVAERARMLLRCLPALVARQDEFADAIVRDTAKPRFEALAEVLAGCDALQWYGKHAPKILADRSLRLHLLMSKKLKISYRPLGVVGVITPWNYPFMLALNPAVQALLAGNAVLLKPSEATPAAALAIQELLREARLPDGLFQVLLGDGETGAALVEAGVHKISFTGSVRTGRRIGEACGRNLVPCTLELGGKDPMIVCADADLERAANAAVYGGFSNSGQACVSTERIYVADEVADEFTRKVIEKTAALRQGASGEFDVGPMIWGPQLDLVARHVDEARARGARVHTGGRRNPDFEGLFYEPTVLTDVDHEMTVMREETFGPVLPIHRVRDEEEAIRLANDSRYGLNASVWTRDKRRGERIAKRVHSGSVVVNDVMLTYGATESPFGGIKESGVGQVNGEIGLRSYCHAQSIMSDRFGAKSEVLWYPYSTRKLTMLRRVMNWMWGTPLGRLLS